MEQVLASLLATDDQKHDKRRNGLKTKHQESSQENSRATLGIPDLIWQGLLGLTNGVPCEEINAGQGNGVHF